MLTIVLRSILIYLIVLLVFRLMGKRQLGQMQPFELVLTLIIADLATIPMAEVSVPVLHGIIPLLTLVVLHFILTLLTKSSVFLSRVISGKPTIIINPKGIDYKAMKNLNLSTDDILAALRECGYFSIGQIQYAIMETNGKISVMPKEESSPLTKEDMKIKCEESFLPITLISEGKIIEANMKIARLEKADLEKMLSDHNVGKIKDLLIFTIDQSGQVYYQKMKGEGVSTKFGRLAKA